MSSKRPLREIADLNIRSNKHAFKKNSEKKQTYRSRPAIRTTEKSAEKPTFANTSNFSFQNLHISTRRFPSSNFLLVNLKLTKSLPNIIDIIVKIIENVKYKTVWLTMNGKIALDLFNQSTHSIKYTADSCKNVRSCQSTEKSRFSQNAGLSLLDIFAPLYDIIGYKTHFESQEMPGSNQVVLYRIERMEKEF